MLEQLVYTRGKPRIDLTANAREIPSDGFGVLNISSGLLPLLSRTGDLAFVHERAAVKNGSNEMGIGLFHSYEYNRVDEETYLLSYEFSRPCSTDPSVAGRSRMNGIFVKQCLVGAPGSRPYEWIGADVWTAWRVPEADYRRDKLPPPLSAVSDQPSGGSIHSDDVDRFLADGRMECAEDALLFLLRQFSLPEEERKVLLIRDTAEQVALWVAAIQRALPERMAREITFATNRSRLSIQPEPTLFCFTMRTDANGRSSQTRRPYCMIVGFHPKDPTCSNLSAAAASHFALLDGQARTLSVRPERTSEEAFFLSAALRNDPDILAFFQRPYGRLSPETAAPYLARLFAADCWLRRGGDGDYEAALACLQCLSTVGLSGDVTLSSDIARCALTVLAKHLQEDESRNWRLTALCQAALRQTGRERELISLLIPYLTGESFSRGGFSRIAALERAASLGNLPECMASVQDALFSGSNLTAMSAYIRQCSPAAEEIAPLLRMYLSRLSTHSITDAQITGSDLCMDFLRCALVALCEDPGLLRDILSRLTGRPALFESLAVLVTGDLADRDSPSRSAWLQTIFTVPGYDPASLYERLLVSNSINPGAMEMLLVSILEQPGSNPDHTLTVFRELVRSGVTVNGLAFCRAMLRHPPRGGLASLINSFQDGVFPAELQETLLRTIDSELSYPDGQHVDLPVMRAMLAWSRSLACAPPVVPTLTLFSSEFCGTKRYTDALSLISSYSDVLRGIRPDARFLRWERFPHMVRHAGSFCSANVHAALLSTFFMSREERNEYISAYVSLLIPDSDGTAAGLLRKAVRKADPGLENASVLLIVSQQFRSDKDNKWLGDLIRQHISSALLSRGERKLSRDLNAYQKIRPSEAFELRRLISPMVH